MTARRKGNRIYLHAPIGEVGAGEFIAPKDVKRLLDECGDAPVMIDINSEGGTAWDSMVIYDMLLLYGEQIATHVSGIAAAGASLIACAGHRRSIAAGGMIMVRNCWAAVAGDADEVDRMVKTMRDLSDGFALSYHERTGRCLPEIRAAMQAETWFNADEARAWGFVHMVVNEVHV